MKNFMYSITIEIISYFLREYSYTFYEETYAFHYKINCTNLLFSLRI